MTNDLSENTLKPQLRWVTFFRQWLKNPRSMASVAPSGKQLSRMMVAALPPDSRMVIELGAGTGAITAALLHSHIEPDNLLALEMNPVLHRVLRQRFPLVHVAFGDARQLHKLLPVSGPFKDHAVDAICSSLGLLGMPATVQHDVLATAFSVLGATGKFIQYTYGLRSPLDDGVRHALGLACRPAGWAWLNLPPARVFVYSRIAPAEPARGRSVSG